MNIINGMHNIKGKTSVNILMSNYTNKHIMFKRICRPSGTNHRGENPENPDEPTMHSINTERMTAGKVELDSFKPPHHKLKQHIETKLPELLKEDDS